MKYSLYIIIQKYIYMRSYFSLLAFSEVLYSICIIIQDIMNGHFYIIREKHCNYHNSFRRCIELTPLPLPIQTANHQ